MTRRCLALLVLCPALAGAAPAEEGPSPKEVRAAVTRALPLLAKGAAGHKEHRTCFACHNQAVPILALTTARSRGFAVDEKELQAHLKFINDFLDGNREKYLKGQGQGGAADTAGAALWTLELGGWKPNATTAAVAEYLLQQNKDKDHWVTRANRPPTEASSFTTTYLALRGLQAYATPEQKERVEKRLEEVRAWLEEAPTKETEDLVFRLWALKRTGADPREVRKTTRALLKLQRSDGGWGQLDKLDPDAYATGTVLVALHQAGGVATDDPAYQRGLRFLLKTQLADGSWHVRSRSRPFQIYFETGFPHGKDQFISIAASGWATTALTLALPVAKGS
jgi:squalene cyclase